MIAISGTDWFSGAPVAAMSECTQLHLLGHGALVAELSAG